MSPLVPPCVRKKCERTSCRNGLRFAILVAAIAIFVLPVVAYIGGYFWLGDTWPSMSPHGFRVRVYGNGTIADAYRPAAWVESQVRGRHIGTATPDDLIEMSP